MSGVLGGPVTAQTPAVTSAEPAPVVPGVAPALPGAAPNPAYSPTSVSAPLPAPTRPTETVAAGAFRPGAPVTLNFQNADIESVARAIGVMNNRQVVVDPRVKGAITMSTERAVTPLQAYNLFLSQIRLQGFTVVESAGLYKVIPEADAKVQTGSVSVGSVRASSSQVQTQIFPLNFENANNLVAVLRPLISPNNTINVNPGNNSLIITDYADNLQRIARIIAALDVSNASDVEVIPLKHALANDLAPVIAKLVDQAGAAAAPGASADTSYRTTLLAEPRTNSLIVRAANPARVAMVKSLVNRLDQPSAGGNGAAGNIYVVHLKNADAVKLAATLRAALSAEARPGTVGQPGSSLATTPATTPTGAAATTTTPGSLFSASGTANQPSTGGQIQADPTTNSLIITAPEPQYRQIRAVIEQLDQRRAQVFVESLIVEVNADRMADFGIQWQTPIGHAGGGAIGVLGTNFSAAVAGANILSMALGGTGANATLPGTGGNIGVFQRVNGRYILGAVGRFIESRGDGNVLSTPNLVTLDNEEARMVVGETRPFVTGQFTNTGTTGSTVNPFQTIERKDVGLILRIKPQINENGTIKMQVWQEVSDVQASTVNDPKGPSTNKRSIESTVLVEDGDIAVLGGLIKDNYSSNTERVPGLADLPIFGALFRSTARTRTRTNLMLFLRPIVLRDAESVNSFSMDRYEMMRAYQRDAQPQTLPSAPVPGGPMLPPVGAQPPMSLPPAPVPNGSGATAAPLVTSTTPPAGATPGASAPR